MNTAEETIQVITQGPLSVATSERKGQKNGDSTINDLIQFWNIP